MKEEITRDEYFDPNEGDGALEWTMDQAYSLRDSGYEVDAMALQPIRDEQEFLTIKIYAYVHGWKRREEEDEPSLSDAFDMKLTPYTSRITLGDQEFPVGEYRMHPNWAKMGKSVGDGDIVAVDPLTGAHATLTNFSKDPNDYPATTADLDVRDHFASEVRALHPTQMDRIERELDTKMRMVAENLDSIRSRLNDIERQIGMVNESGIRSVDIG